MNTPSVLRELEELMVKAFGVPLSRIHEEGAKLREDLYRDHESRMRNVTPETPDAVPMLGDGR